MGYDGFIENNRKGMMNKKLTLLAVFIFSAVFFSACTPKQSLGTKTSNSEAGQIEEKHGTTTKTGLISENAGIYFLQEAGANPEEIDSYAVDLSNYLGQTVTVSGQYSGDTLFVGSIE